MMMSRTCSTKMGPTLWYLKKTRLLLLCNRKRIIFLLQDESLQMIESLENTDGSFKVPKAPGGQKRGRPRRAASHKTNGNVGKRNQIQK
jgi:hypothetical protein